MELFRHGHDVWGQPVVDGLAWSLLDVAVGAGLAVIVIHFIYRAVKMNSSHKRRS